MSAEEDTELRDLVAQCLETNGVLNKIRVSEKRPRPLFHIEGQADMKRESSFVA